MIIVFALLLSILYLIAKFVRVGANFFDDTISLSTVLFILTFYLPIIFLPDSYNWYKFSDATKMYAVIAHFSLVIGSMLSGFFKIRIKNISNNLNDYTFQNYLLILIWLVGISLYLLMYAIKGIPVFSGRVEYARQEFLSGNGFILKPAIILINLSIIFSFIYKRYYYFIVFFSVGTFIVLLSGWRGNLLNLIVMILALLSIQRKLKLKWGIYALAVVYAISLIGLLRAHYSGHSIYGLSLNNPLEVIKNPFLYVILRLGIHSDTFNIVVTHFTDRPMMGEALLIDFKGIISGSGQTVVYYLKDLFADFESGGGFPPTMFGAFYMDFNVYGIVFLTIIFVCLHDIVRNYFRLKSSKNSVYLYLYASVISGFFTSFLGTFVKYYFSNLLFNSLVLIFVILLDKILKGKVRF